MRSDSAAPTPPSPSASTPGSPDRPTDAAAVEARRRRDLGERLGHRVRDGGLLERALTHASYANEHGPVAEQGALALLGDAVLALVVAEQLMAEDPAAGVGALTPRRAAIVSGANLARWAARLRLGELVRLGRGEDQTGGRTRESILATTLEAVLGVVYLEGGLPAVRTAVTRLIREGERDRVIG